MTTPQPYAYPPQEPTVIYSPGGLSTTAHLVSIILVLGTCGLWLPIYVIMILNAPTKRVQVIAPYGTPPEHVEAIRRQALAGPPMRQQPRQPEVLLTPEERRRSNRKILIVFSILLGVIVVIVLVVNLIS